MSSAWNEMFKIPSTVQPVEKIAHAASQLRYKLEITLQHNFDLEEQLEDARRKLDGGERKNSACPVTPSVATITEKDDSPRHPRSSKLISQKDAQIQIMRREVSDLKVAVSNAVERVRHKDSQLETAKKDLIALRTQLESNEREKTRLENEVKAIDRYVRSSKSEYDLLRGISSKKQEYTAAVSAEFGKMKEENKRLEELLRAMSLKCDRQFRENEDIQQRFSSLNEECHKLRADLTVRSNLLSKATYQNEQQKLREERLEMSLRELQEQLQREVREVSKLANLMNDSESRAQSALDCAGAARSFVDDVVKRYSYTLRRTHV
jgi:chromosome segregation ATPase